MVGWVVNCELDRVWKEWAVDYSVENLEKLGRNTKNLSEYNKWSNQHSKQVSIEYKSAVLLLNHLLFSCASPNINRLLFYKFTFTCEQHWRSLEQVIVKLNPNSPFFLFQFITTVSRTFTQIYIQTYVAKYVLGESHVRLKLVYLIQFVLAVRSMETWYLPHNNAITDFVCEKRNPRLCCCTSVM